MAKAFVVLLSAFPAGLAPRQLQWIYFRSRHRISFPGWSVDVTVDELMERLLLLFMKAAGVDDLPFIWFWRDGAVSAAIMSQDVETDGGREFLCRIDGY